MNPQELAQHAQQYAHLGLTWIGFGTLVGLMAKAIMPGRDPGGPVATLLMGVAGTIIGCGVVTFFWGQHVTPISAIGFLSGTGGSFLLLLFYRLLGGYFFTEGQDGIIARRPAYRRRAAYARRRRSTVYEDGMG
jgi:uncharacterized membrane protein YeaQ/YmgE (transglycosylase-associated protein family)